MLKAKAALCALALVVALAAVPTTAVANWQKALELGQEELAKLFPDGKLPVQIAGDAFTEENLKLWFELKPGATAQNYNSTAIVERAKSSRAGSAGLEILKLVCELLCSTFIELLGNQDTYDKRTIEAAVIPQQAYNWDSVSEVKGVRKLSGNHWWWDNVFGTRLVDIWFSWEFYYGGRYDGRGAYLTSVTPVVSVENGALQACEFSTRALNHRNVGTANGPVAAVDIEITLFCKGTHTIMATFKGDGEAYAWDGQGGRLEKDASVDPESSDGCFDGASTLKRQDGSLVAMADLRLGDMVESHPGHFEPVLLLPKHWTGLARTNSGISAKFQRIHAGQHAVTLTPSHQIYVASGKGNQTLALKRADQVRQGDFVLNESSELVQVQDNEIVDSVGLYTPYTQSLKIMVGGVQASCLIDHVWLASGLVLSIWALVSSLLRLLLAALGPAAYGALVDLVCFAVVEPCYWNPVATLTVVFATGAALKAVWRTQTRGK